MQRRVVVTSRRAERMAASADASTSPYAAIRVRGAVATSPVDASHRSDGRTRRGDDDDESRASSSVFDDDDGRDARDSSTSHVVRVFAQIEGGVKQAIAASTSDPGGARAEACERACATACERAGTCADAEDAVDVCGIACAHACERESDARGKFEVNVRAGSEEARRWEDELRERARAERARDARLVGTDGDGEDRREGE